MKDIKGEADLEDSSPIARRKVLKGTAYTGALVGGVSITTANTRGSSPTDGDTLEITAPFVSVSLKVPTPEDAVEIDSSSRFPPTIKTESGTYLPQSPVELFEDGQPGVVIGTPHGIKQATLGSVITQSPVSTAAPSGEEGNLLAESSVSADIILQSIGNTATVQFGSDELQVQENERTTRSRQVNLIYQTVNGEKSKIVDATLSIKNHGQTTLKSHQNLVVIPKDSPGGQHIREVMRPKLEENGRVGSWVDIIELTAIDAWGIELATNGGGKP